MMQEKRARALHRALWHWLAKHPGAWKADWPGWVWKKHPALAVVYMSWDMCFACYYARGCYDDEGWCPIEDKALVCRNPDSLWQAYKVMRKSSDYEKWADVCNRMADAWPLDN